MCGLPMTFVKKYGKEVSSPVQLKVPNGDEWSIRLRKHGGEIWLQTGFRSSLTYGSLLVFQYEGNCLFNVHIFDESAMEISYPFKN
ncbi:hypothetical protein Tsubulata_009864 [Turnera subulata]|uniref:TF-B3 domain-containing protein n=1 Tax=Turnera subulata TaxID=218843 RepID=A0A9Q0G7H4_9ROSI|nr:hypothetical protein Tsubulata_009864 [Turnera subulata]